MKEKKHEYQREFRFVFALSHPLLGILSVKKEAKILNINPLKPAVKNLVLED